ncbi:MAG: SUMF1/EgtB/PvdO family nonheme iron enzyme [Magnetococcales bacterium]|nr:SUMF1/EgtB/PvdO family nonheme iron enzyme [Magnetococcales bacterium]
MSNGEPLRWLHISDIHWGGPGQADLWPRIEEQVRNTLAGTNRVVPDLVFVTGDIVWDGTGDQYKQFDAFLKNLLGWLNPDKSGTAPLVVPVPGNHDLQRPKGRQAFPFAILEHFSKGNADNNIKDLNEELWEDKNASFFEPLFENYRAWLKKSILPTWKKRGICFHQSHFPGDVSLHLDLPGRPPLSVVGINSAWRHFEDLAEGRLELFRQQLLFALGEGGLPSLRGRNALLLMHHPRVWFSPASSKIFYEHFYPPEQFNACLCGHGHHGYSESISVSGGLTRHFLHAPSLFGLENHGKPNESLSCGFAWGELDHQGGIRLWPLRYRRQEDGAGNFALDQYYSGDLHAGVVLPGKKNSGDLSPPPPPYDLSPWLRNVLDRTGKLEIRGIGSGAGRSQEAGWYDIETLYTPLSSRGEAGGVLESRGEPVSLAELLAGEERLLIEGQPGAGKTTFLKLVAALLCRDLLGMPGPEDGGSWRWRHLGLSDGSAAPVPLFLRLSELAALLAREQPPYADNALRLLDLLDFKEERGADEAWRGHWTGLLERGEALLLLDGLDEVADEGLRRRVIAIVQEATRRWEKCRLVVSSRPHGVEQMRGLGFHHAVIEPFGTREIEEFTRRWSDALYERPGSDNAVAVAHRDKLLKAILEKPTIRLLASNPVMLTCLCVVHWHEGDLPEGRARVYQAVIRWLLASRTEMRQKAGYENQFALEAFVALALAMMTAMAGRKVAVFDLQDGAEAVAGLVTRYFPQLLGRAARQKCGRDWLMFECLGSGIVEELGRQRLKYWHLTFQEYLAARALAWLGDGDEAGEDWWPVLRERLDDSQWRETVELFPGTLFDEGGSRRVDRLLGRVLRLRGETPDLADEARVAGILGRLLQPMSAYQYRPPVEIEENYRAMLERVMPIFTRAGAAQVPVGTRIAAAEALGRGGDPRLARENFAKPEYLIEVPETGGWKLRKFLVTVMEYQEFVERGGYQEPKWWDGEGWKQRSERGWESPGDWDAQTQHPNRPVTGVSWYEARAYCRWLSGQRGEILCLPEREVWLRATGSKEDKYPWGDAEPNAERANYGRNVEAPTPVGIYPAGDGPLGHCDLAGNVWEWQRDLYSAVFGFERAAPLDPVVTENSFWVIMGGSWVDPADSLSAAFRSWSPAWVRVGLGFRVAAAPAGR